MLVVESLVDLHVSFGEFDNCFDHDFARVDKVRLLERIVLFEACADDDGQLSAAQNDLRAMLILLEFFDKDDEIINDLIPFVSCLDSVDDALEKILVLLA